MLSGKKNTFVHPEDRGPIGRLRWRLYQILEVGTPNDPATVVFDTLLITLILTNAAAFAMATVDSIHEEWGHWLELFNVISIGIFTVEYLTRLWICVDLPPMRHLGGWKARLDNARSPLMIVDLVAILPFYLGTLFGLDLRALRLLRLLRFLKIARYSPALQTLYRTVQSESRALFGALIIMAALVLLSASMMYWIEREAQPVEFGSVPAAMWWSLATLTTIGYGDVVPVTPAGRIVGSFFMVFGLAMYALPVGIISSGFVREISRREFVVSWTMVANVSIFSKMSAADISHVQDLLQSHRFQAGHVICRPGDPADSMFFIARGEVRVEGEGHDTKVLRQGEHFGEMALLRRRRRKDAVIADTDCELLVLEAQDFEHLIASHPNVALHMQRAMNNADAANDHSHDASPGQVEEADYETLRDEYAEEVAAKKKSDL